MVSPPRIRRAGRPLSRTVPAARRARPPPRRAGGTLAVLPDPRREGGALDRRPRGRELDDAPRRDAEIRDYVRYLGLVARQTEEGRRGEEPVRTVLGFSQGVHTAARWVCLGGLRTGTLVLWGASLPEDLPDGAAGRLAATRLILVRGREDRLRRPDAEEAEERWLGRAGIDWTVRTHGGGHEIVPPSSRRSPETPGPEVTPDPSGQGPTPSARVTSAFWRGRRRGRPEGGSARRSG